MTETTQPGLSNRTRARRIGRAGWVIIALSAGSALLPMADRALGAIVVGWLLVAAGLIEVFAGTLRHETRVLAMLAGAVTTLAGLLFLLDPVTQFLRTVTIIIGWLLLRSLILLLTSLRAHGSVRMWLGLSALTDFVLGLMLLVGLSISTLVTTLFGPTPTLVASFAWVLALSFVVTGTMLLEVASCERKAED